MDMKTYILVGGGLLIGLVLLHALVSAWRDSRRGSNADGGEADPETLDLTAEDSTAMLWTDDAQAIPPDEPPAAEVVAEADPAPPVATDRAADDMEADAADVAEAAMEAETAMEAEDVDAVAAESSPVAEFAASAETPAPTVIDDPHGALRKGRRIEIAGKRTEPTVPRAMRPEYRRLAPHAERPESLGEANGGEPPDDVIVFWVFAQPGKLLDGEALLKAFASHGLKCDADLVFKKTDPRCGGHWYTVANGVEPGTFDISRPAALETPGVVMLLPLGQVRDPMAGFENMLDVAQDLASTLDGELKDERRSDMSWQTIEHCRQRISDFKRMRLRT